MRTTEQEEEYSREWDKGFDLYCAGRHVAAAETWKAAFSLSNRLGDPARQCRSAFSVGSMFSRAGHFRQALPYFLRATHRVHAAKDEIARRLYREAMYTMTLLLPLGRIQEIMADFENLLLQRPWFEMEQAFARANLQLARGFPEDAHELLRSYIVELEQRESSCCSPAGLVLILFRAAFHSHEHKSAVHYLQLMKRLNEQGSCERCQVYICASELMLARVGALAVEDWTDCALRLIETMKSFDTKVDFSHLAALRLLIGAGQADEAARIFWEYLSADRVENNIHTRLFQVDLSCARLAQATGTQIIDFEFLSASPQRPSPQRRASQSEVQTLLGLLKDTQRECEAEDQRLECDTFTQGFRLREEYVHYVASMFPS